MTADSHRSNATGSDGDACDVAELRLGEHHSRRPPVVVLVDHDRVGGASACEVCWQQAAKHAVDEVEYATGHTCNALASKLVAMFMVYPLPVIVKALDLHTSCQHTQQGAPHTFTRAHR